MGQNNALHFICQLKRSSSLDLVRLLIVCGIDIAARDFKGDSALHKLCRYSESENLFDLIRLLVEAKVDVKAETLSGSTAVNLLWERNVEHFSDIIQFLMVNF